MTTKTKTKPKAKPEAESPVADLLPIIPDGAVVQRLLVPSCGAKFTLTEDWTFRLFYESRNEALLVHFGMYSKGYVDEPIYGQIPNPKFDPKTAGQYKSHNSGPFWGHSYMVGNPDYDANGNSKTHWGPTGQTRPKLETQYGNARKGKSSDDYEIVTLPAGTELVCHRVYIRQSAVPDKYNSLTWTAQVTSTLPGKPGADGKPGKPTKKKHRARFWAKLSDCNEMVGYMHEATLLQN